MRDLIIGKDIAYALKVGGGTIAGVWEADVLTDGGIAIVDDEGALVAHNADPITAPYVELLTKTTTGSKRSFPLYNGQVEFSKLAYSAPVAKIMAVGSEEAAAAGNKSLNLPATISIGDVVGIGISNNSVPHEKTVGKYQDYTITVVSGDVLTGTGANNIITKLVAKINADPKKIVTALAHEDGAGNNDGIKLTGDTAGIEFNVYHIEGVLQNAEMSVVTKGEKGHGTAKSIAELLTATASRDGDNQYLKNTDLLYSGGNQIGASDTYTTYVLRAKVPNTDVISQSNKPPMELVIAVPSGSAAIIAAIDNLADKFV